MDKIYAITHCCASCKHGGEAWVYEWFCNKDGINTKPENRVEPFFYCTKFTIRDDLKINED